MFKYNDRVKVTSGFYEGMEGTTTVRSNNILEARFVLENELGQEVDLLGNLVEKNVLRDDGTIAIRVNTEIENAFKIIYIPESSLELIK